MAKIGNKRISTRVNAQQKNRASKGEPNDFKSVARRLECDEDKERFENKLGKIAKATTESSRTRKPNHG